MMKLLANKKQDDAVSPVIGVMLMLVVTIIIAAVVVAFAGGIGGDADFSEPMTFEVNLDNNGLLIKALNTPKDMQFGKDYFVAVSEPGDPTNFKLLSYDSVTSVEPTIIYYNIKNLTNSALKDTTDASHKAISGWMYGYGSADALDAALKGKPVTVKLCSQDGTKIYGTVTTISTINYNRGLDIQNNLPSVNTPYAAGETPSTP